MNETTRFLVARTIHGVNRIDVGVSSDALIAGAISGSDIPLRDYPRDTGDLGRCLRTYSNAPAELRQKMKPHLVLYLRAIADDLAERAVSR